MEKISEELSKLIDETEKDFEGDNNYKELKDAVDKYNDMLKQGIIKKRGYNLLSIDQANIKHPIFNSQ